MRYGQIPLFIIGQNVGIDGPNELWYDNFITSKRLPISDGNERGYFMEGQYATLKDVAERAGTTAATVSYILNG